MVFMFLYFDDRKPFCFVLSSDDRTNLADLSAIALATVEALRAKPAGTRNTDGFYVALLRKS